MVTISDIKYGIRIPELSSMRMVILCHCL